MHRHFTKQTVSPKRNLALTQGSNYSYVEKKFERKLGKNALEFLMSRNMSRNESQTCGVLLKQKWLNVIQFQQIFEVLFIILAPKSSDRTAPLGVQL